MLVRMGAYRSAGLHSAEELKCVTMRRRLRTNRLVLKYQTVPEQRDPKLTRRFIFEDRVTFAVAIGEKKCWRLSKAAGLLRFPVWILDDPSWKKLRSKTKDAVVRAVLSCWCIVKSTNMRRFQPLRKWPEQLASFKEKKAALAQEHRNVVAVWTLQCGHQDNISPFKEEQRTALKRQTALGRLTLLLTGSARSKEIWLAHW